MQSDHGSLLHICCAYRQGNKHTHKQTLPGSCGRMHAQPVVCEPSWSTCLSRIHCQRPLVTSTMCYVRLTRRHVE
jgi:hypothetical protein